VAQDAGCQATTEAETTVIVRGTESGEVDGLSVGTAYDCYVIAVNAAGSVCSDKVAFSPVPPAPAPPTNVQTMGTNTVQWTGGWTAAAESRPLTYSTKCVDAGDSEGCFGTGRGAGESGLTTLTGKVVGLTPGTAYDCFAVSVLVGDGQLAKCSAPVRYTTGPLTPAGKPTDVATDALLSDATSWYVDWKDGAVGDPQETYTLKCVAQDAGCQATTEAETTGIVRGTESGEVDGLSVGTAYDCYVIAVNAAGSVCSDKVVYYGSFTSGVLRSLLYFFHQRVLNMDSGLRVI